MRHELPAIEKEATEFEEMRKNRIAGDEKLFLDKLLTCHFDRLRYIKFKEKIAKLNKRLLDDEQN
jgi:hypothetical protein